MQHSKNSAFEQIPIQARPRPHFIFQSEIYQGIKGSPRQICEIEQALSLFCNTKMSSMSQKSHHGSTLAHTVLLFYECLSKLGGWDSLSLAVVALNQVLQHSFQEAPKRLIFQNDQLRFVSAQLQLGFGLVLFVLIKEV